MDRDRDARLFAQLILERGPILRLGEPAGDEDDAIISAAGVDQALYVVTRLLLPRLLGTERESPPFLAGISLALIIEFADFLGNRIGLGVRLAVATAIGAGLRPQVAGDRALTELAAEDLKGVRLVALGEGFQMIFEERRIQHIVGAAFGIRVVLRSKLAHELRRQDANLRGLIFVLRVVRHRTRIESVDDTVYERRARPFDF